MYDIPTKSIAIKTNKINVELENLTNKKDDIKPSESNISKMKENIISNLGSIDNKKQKDINIDLQKNNNSSEKKTNTKDENKIACIDRVREKIYKIESKIPYILDLFRDQLRSRSMFAWLRCRQYHDPSRLHKDK